MPYMTTPAIKRITECFIRPKYEPPESNQPIYLAPWDLAMLSAHYIQKGLLFVKPPPENGRKYHIEALLEKLKDSLSLALIHFYPLAGRLATSKVKGQNACLVYIDCKRGPGAKFIHAALDVTISHILSPTDVPVVVQSFFDHDRAVNHDGHDMPLLSIQVTELVDGIFIGCSINHVTADGTSYWHFFNMWSEIHRAQGKNITISRPPIHQRWFPDGHGSIIYLPYSHPDQFISRYEAPQLRERIFHFSLESLAKLKARANIECNTDKISTFQALSALIWRSITSARCLPHNQETSCRLAINNRQRLDPPLHQQYFGNSIQTVKGVTTAGELVNHNLGWAAMLLHQAVLQHTSKTVHDFLKGWLQSPFIYQLGQFFDSNSIMMGSSPKFDMYGNEFGIGKATAILSGYANKFDGKVTSYPGRQGGGSVDLEICLPPDSMAALESDEEFVLLCQ